MDTKQYFTKKKMQWDTSKSKGKYKKINTLRKKIMKTQQFQTYGILQKQFLERSS